MRCTGYILYTHRVVRILCPPRPFTIEPTQMHNDSKNIIKRQYHPTRAVRRIVQPSVCNIYIYIYIYCAQRSTTHITPVIIGFPKKSFPAITRARNNTRAVREKKNVWFYFKDYSLRVIVGRLHPSVVSRDDIIITIHRDDCSRDGGGVDQQRWWLRGDREWTFCRKSHIANRLCFGEENNCQKTK